MPPNGGPNIGQIKSYFDKCRDEPASPKFTPPPEYRYPWPGKVPDDKGEHDPSRDCIVWDSYHHCWIGAEPEPTNPMNAVWFTVEGAKECKAVNPDRYTMFRVEMFP